MNKEIASQVMDCIREAKSQLVQSDNRNNPEMVRQTCIMRAGANIMLAQFLMENGDKLQMLEQFLKGEGGQFA